MLLDAKLLKALAAVTSKETARGTMTCVSVAGHGEYVELAASDAYSIAVCKDARFKDNGVEQYLLPADFIKEAVRGDVATLDVYPLHVDALNKNGEAVATYERDFTKRGRNYFNYQKLLEAPQKHAESVTLNADFIAAGCKIARVFFGKNTALDVQLGESAMKPPIIQAHDAERDFMYLIMPIRRIR